MRNLYQKTHLTNNLPDRELWKEFKKGDEEAFSIVFHKYYSYLYNYGSKITSDKDLIKDSIQELFIILWESRERLGDTESVKFYLLKSFRRHLIRRFTNDTKNRDKYNLPEEYQFEFVFSYEKSLIIEQSFQEQQTHLLAALNSLSPRQKEVIYLRFYDNLSYQEISEITALNYQSVRNYIHQAIQTLRKKKSLLASLLATLFCFLAWM
jgi:RNA polymerase sigma factor (sigma-70 family)